VLFLLIVVLAVTVTGFGLYVQMYRRDQPLYGVAALSTMMVAAIIGSVYAMMAD
jgi:hypothetical protein